jgi:cell division protein FtsW
VSAQVHAQRPAPARRLAWPPLDPVLLVLTVVLPLGGVVLVASARMPAVLGQDSLLERVTIQQMIFALIGVGLALGLSAVDYRRYGRVAIPALAVAGIALVAVLFVHDPSQPVTARRWFPLGDLTIQPSEFAKIAMILALATLAQRMGPRVREWRIVVLGFGGIVALLVIPVIFEPDLGTGVTMAFVGFAMAFAAGARLRHLAALAGMATALAAVSIGVNDYQRVRLLTFLSGDQDLANTGYQAAQAQIALGSGGITGRGLGLGTQKFLLPVPDSDSVFAVIGEEFGLVGTGLVLVLFLALFVRGVQIAAVCEDVLGRLLAIGIVTQITFQAFVNMAVVTGLIPVTGITLPFVSRGGSSLMASLILMGILLNVARHAGLRGRG